MVSADCVQPPSNWSGMGQNFFTAFSDPVNPNIHPGVTTGVNLVGTAMANRFAMKKMGGVV